MPRTPEPRNPFNLPREVWERDDVESCAEWSLEALEAALEGREVLGGTYYCDCDWLPGCPRQYYAFVGKKHATHGS